MDWTIWTFSRDIAYSDSPAASGRCVGLRTRSNADAVPSASRPFAVRPAWHRGEGKVGDDSGLHVIVLPLVARAGCELVADVAKRSARPIRRHPWRDGQELSLAPGIDAQVPSVSLGLR